MCRLLAPAWFPCCSESGCNAIGSLLAPYRFALSALGGCRSVRCGGAWAVVGGACYGAISMHQPNVPKINRRIKQIYLYMYTCMCEYICICIMCVYTCICICICIYIYIYIWPCLFRIRHSDLVVKGHHSNFSRNFLKYNITNTTLYSLSVGYIILILCA